MWATSAPAQPGHAANLAVHHRPAQVIAIDASPAQHAMATDLYAHLVPCLRIVQQLLDKAGLTDITVDVLPAATGGPRTADTLLMSAYHPSCSSRG